jgi:predicted HicB family RNase H-like nuclease
MTIFRLKKAANPEKLRVLIPDTLHSQLSYIAARGNTTLDDLVCQCLTFALRQLRIEDDPSTGRYSQK